MRRLATFGLAAALALTELSVATDADAGHRRWHDSGVSFGFSFGSPSYYDDYYYAPRYRPYYQPRRYAPRRQIRGNWRAHTEWCYARWRSYDAYNNSYQPYRGPRRECRSPYY